jgi:dolichol kinase
MDFTCWGLSVDSLIAAGAISSVVPPRHIVPLILLFGICDAVASVVGQSPSDGVVIALALSWLAPVVVVACGVAFLVQRSGIAARLAPWRFSYLLPPLMAADNLLVPAQWPIEAGLISSAMAALGFASGFVLWRRVAGPTRQQRLSGALLVTAGLLMAT